MANVNLEKSIRSLEEVEREKLLELWTPLFGAPPPTKLSAQLLRKAIAQRMQTQELGGGPTRVHNQLRSAICLNAPAPARRLRPGARLIREWNGTAHIVEVVADGFRYRDRIFASLSSVAKEITGAKWSGPRFFGLRARTGT